MLGLDWDESAGRKKKKRKSNLGVEVKREVKGLDTRGKLEGDSWLKRRAGAVTGRSGNPRLNSCVTRTLEAGKGAEPLWKTVKKAGVLSDPKDRVRDLATEGYF